MKKKNIDPIGSSSINRSLISALIDKGALFVINHSGGKDSQAMYLYLSQIVPAHQILVVYAQLPGVVWPETQEHIQNTIWHPLAITRAKKTFFEMVRHRGMFPSPEMRQCTSDLKRGPIQKIINNYAKANGFLYVVNCEGLRAQESSKRAKRIPLKFDEGSSCRHRIQFDYLPIFNWSEEDVFFYIGACGQVPHWAYSLGMKRLSCCFCIMASTEDLITAATLMPVLYAEYCKTEIELNFTLIMPRKGQSPRFLPEITGISYE